jgi:signal peptidase II
MVAGIDQATKAWALAALGDGRTVPVLGRWLQLHLTANSGAAFSFGAGATWVFTILTGVVIAVVWVALRRVTSRAWVAAGVMVLGGGAGNLVDRLVRPPGVGVGHVVDFIAYGNWFIGNVADIALVAAVGLAIVLLAVGVHPSRGEAPTSGVSGDEAE